MATINGAKALGLENEIGSIEIDKCADLIAIDLNQIETMPLNSLFSSIVYAAGREQFCSLLMCDLQDYACVGEW